MERPYAHLIREYPVMIHSLGPDGKLTVGAAFDMLQDIAGLHAAELGVGMPQLNSLGITWVLSRMIVNFEKYPDASDTIRLTTWPSGLQRLFALRQFEFISAKTGERFGTASSFWLMLKTDNLRPVVPSSVASCEHWITATDDIPVFFREAGKIPAEAGGHPLKVTIGQSMIDSNRHVNNTHYAQFAQDWLAASTGAPVCIRRIQVNFNLALRLFEDVEISGEADGDTFRVTGFNGEGRNVFTASGLWSKM